MSMQDEYAGRCLFEKGADWYPFCLGGGTKRGVKGGGGGQPKNHTCLYNYFFLSLLVHFIMCMCVCDARLIAIGVCTGKTEKRSC